VHHPGIGCVERGAQRRTLAGEPMAAALDARLIGGQPLPQRLRQHRERQGGVAGHRKVAGKIADPVAREDRVDSHVDDLGAGCRRHRARNPGHVAFEHQDCVGLVHERRGRKSHVHRMVARKAERFRHMAHHWQREALGERRQRRDCSFVLAETRGDHERTLCTRQDIGCLGNGGRVGDHRPCRRLPMPWRAPCRELGGQDLARQRQIDRSPRLAHRDRQRPVDSRVDLLGQLDFVVPFHCFANQAGLVQHFLGPVNEQTARRGVTDFRERCATRRDQQRNSLAVGVHQGADRIGRADVDVKHDGLRPPGH
jgi:hypothetical protein